MIIGCIFTAFNMEDYLPQSIAPWVAARVGRLDDHQFVICAVSVPFTGFPNEGCDQTADILHKHLEDKEIDHLITGDDPMAETEARGAALTWLKTQDVDVIIQVDADEVYSERDISRIFRFVGANPFVPTYRLSLKNYFQTTTTYLADPFTPMRIHQVRLPATKAGVLEASGFWADNNVYYQLPGGAPVRDDQFACLTIPSSVAFVKHWSWLSTDRSRRKVEYHENHFTSRPAGFRSSYRWDGEHGLVFNEGYYAYVGQPLPRLLKDQP